MSRTIQKRSECFEGESLVAVGRIEGADGMVLQQAHVTTVDMNVYDTNDMSAPAFQATGMLSADVMYDALQFDGFEDQLGDGGGYNFRHTYSTEDWAVGSHTYLVEYAFNTNVLGVRKEQVLLSVRGSPT